MPTLADAKLGGGASTRDSTCATYTALVTTSDVTLSHRDDFRPDRCHGATGAIDSLRGPVTPMDSMRILRQLETIYPDANFGAPSQRGFLKVKINDLQSNHLPHH